MTKEEASKRKDEKACYCPYCDGDMSMSMPFCKGCGAQLRFCSQCSEPLPQDAQVCPNCGAEAVAD
jgi:predicted amidophosphoribosyltransferase